MLCDKHGCGGVGRDRTDESVSNAKCRMSYPQSHPKHCEELVVACDDPINHPSHYTHGIIEPIDVIESWGLNFSLGSVLKYICRLGHKGERLEQLLKAQWYLNREVERERRRCE